jgi:hypothetical protein
MPAGPVDDERRHHVTHGGRELETVTREAGRDVVALGTDAIGAPVPHLCRYWGRLGVRHDKVTYQTPRFLRKPARRG